MGALLGLFMAACVTIAITMAEYMAPLYNKCIGYCRGLSRSVVHCWSVACPRIRNGEG